FQLRYLVRKLGLTHRVTFPGFVPHDRISDLFYSADVFVMPSIVHSTGDRDGIPTVIMEALLHRLPVVASDVSGISEVIRNGRLDCWFNRGTLQLWQKQSVQCSATGKPRLKWPKK